MGRIIKAKEFQAENAVSLARWLLGKNLVRRQDDGRVVSRAITEVEAYNGEGDLACHARAGRTARTEVLYEAGGVWYVYLCYGIHEMLNLVVGPRDWPAAILIRGVAEIEGPGRVTKALGIGRQFNRAPADATSGLWIEEGREIPLGEIEATPRIGIDFAGPVWAQKPWRFIWRPRALPARQSSPPKPKSIRGSRRV